MHYVSPCLLAEGKTDNRMLIPLVRRVLEDLLFGRARGVFELAEVVAIGDSAGLLPPIDICQVVATESEPFSLILIHRDADARDREKADAWVADVRTCLETHFELRSAFVVPVRMSEAWLLADGDALRAALGVTWGDQELGVPTNPASVENIADPKAVLRSLTSRLSGPPVDPYERIAERVRLDVLRRIASFTETEQALRQILSSQGVI